MPEAVTRGISPPFIKRRRVEAPQPIHLAPSIPPRPITTLESNQCRVFSWNVNGIAPFLQPPITSYFKASRSKRKRTPPTEDEESIEHSLSECIIRWRYPQVIGLQEIKVKPGDTQTIRSIQQAVKKSQALDPGYKVHFSLPRDKHNATGFNGKVYGVAMLVREDILDPEVTVSAVDWDLEGRVLLLKIPRRKLAVFNVYAVNGTENPWFDSRSGAAIGTRHDKKRAFHSDLSAAVHQLEREAFTVIIAGDMNIARAPIDGFPGIRLAAAHVENRADFETKFMSPDQELPSLLDTYRHLHSEERKYSYRSRAAHMQWGESCDRVDLILASARAAAAVYEADILDTVTERGPSDHVPIYVTLDLDKIDQD